MAFSKQSVDAVAGYLASASTINAIIEDLFTKHHQYTDSTKIENEDVSDTAAIAFSKIDADSSDLSSRINQDAGVSEGKYIISRFALEPMIFGLGLDGVTTISSRVTLSSHVQYDSLVLETGGVLVANGYRIQVRNTASFVGGYIEASGANGNAGQSGVFANASGGAAVSPSYDGEWVNVGTVQGGNANPSFTAGLRATGSAQKAMSTYSTTSNLSGDGGQGFYSGAIRAGGIAAGIALDPYFKDLRNFETMINPWDHRDAVSVIQVNSQVDGGASGGGRYAGAGGSAGEHGGVVVLAARILSLLTGSTYISAVGGDGGAGGAGHKVGSDEGGGGGGGRGGDGGTIFQFYGELIGTASIDVAAGSGGIGGLVAGGALTASPGQAGDSGHTGSIRSFQLI